MRGIRSSKQETKQGMEIDKLNKLKEDPAAATHLSGAYIRNLVKELTSSRSKIPMNSKDSGCVDDDGFCSQKFGENQQPQQHKKQVRRRLHTSKPYKERLLNMAEARREIVAALKFHRANMKQAHEKEHQQEQQQKQASSFEQENKKIKSRRNPRIYPSNSAEFSNYADSLSCTCFSHAPPPPYPFCWPTPTPTPPPPPPPLLPSPIIENLNFPLPNQTLGLNLNFQHFNDLDTSLYHTGNNPSSVYSSSSSPSSFSPSSPSISIAADDIHMRKPQEGTPAESYGKGGGLHQVMDDEGMAEMRSIGEQHQMEWNDTMNLVTSAWWFKFLKSMESGPAVVKPEDDDIYQPFDQVMEFPSWLNATDGCFQQHFDDYFSPDYYHDPSLPRMDIGEIEGMDDGEWLA